MFFFLPIFLLVYFGLPSKGIFRNLWFVLASLLFYFWGEQGFILILLFSILFNYLIGLQIAPAESNTRKQFLLLGVILNLLTLIYFKYALFIADGATWFLSDDWKSGTLWTHLNSIYLPLGISFFTFQSISYLVDVYRKEAPVEKNLLNLACYIAMFPQLVAGPIVRYQTIAKQIQDRNLSKEKISFGIVLFIIGLSYKVLLANSLARSVDIIFGMSHDQLTPILTWIATLGYTFQIYFDFCGYSTMAVGLGWIMGFQFPHNFNFPYISGSITEFWRRWHITLSRWFRDYLYIPLGGNRNGEGRTYFNLLMVFILCGLWHGAAWNFLFWGLYHGFFLVIERMGLKKILDQLPKPLSIAYTFFIVIIGWVFFRATSFEQAGVFLKSMIGFAPVAEVKYWSAVEIINPIFIIAMIFSVLLATPLFNKLFFLGDHQNQTLCSLQKMPATRLGPVWLILIASCFFLSCLMLVTQTYNPFIYFRF